MWEVGRRNQQRTDNHLEAFGRSLCPSGDGLWGDELAGDLAIQIHVATRDRVVIVMPSWALRMIPSDRTGEYSQNWRNSQERTRP
jgi:hypothetical protein